MGSHSVDKPEVYGVMAEFEGPDEAIAATKRVIEAGYKKIDVYSSFPVEELNDLVSGVRERVPWLALLVLGGGISGTIGGFLLQWWVSTIAYPVNIGTRPLASWPSFVIVSFETTILLAAFAAVFGMILINGLPMPYHPVFNVSEFLSASDDGFFLCIESEDPKFDLEKTKAFLSELNPKSISEVEPAPEGAMSLL